MAYDGGKGTQDDHSIGTIARVITARYPEGFWTMFNTCAAFFAGVDRPAVYYKALFATMAHLDEVEWRRVSAARLAASAMCSKSNMERGLAMLEADNVILGRGRGSNKERRLSRRVSWRRGADQYIETLEIDGEDPPLRCAVSEARFRSSRGPQSVGVSLPPQ